MVTSAADGAHGTLVLRLFMLSGLFLLGLAVGRSGLPSRLKTLRRNLFCIGALCLAVGLGAGVALNLMEVPHGICVMLYLDTPMIALGYLMLLTAALHGQRQGWLHSFLAPLGRMSLTGYLGASILGQMLFYGWGFKLMGQMGTLAVVAMAIAIAFLLTAFAHLWFRRFVYGPWEWLWRRLAHFGAQRMMGHRIGC
jgi:uncharacterized protein